jgi:ADP-ribose pyrophosphatase YjhB (NUDIX family)
MSVPTTIRQIAHGLAERAPVLLDDAELARAAVALVLAPGAEGLSFLLVERARFDGDPWSGHLALPGGRRRADDVDLRATAERETREEVGLDLAGGARLVARHDDLHATVQPIAIATFVYGLPAIPALPAPAAGGEIAAVAWCPLARLYEPARRDVVRVTWRDRALELPAVRVLDEPQRPLLWGLTYRILATLLARAGEPLEAA